MLCRSHEEYYVSEDRERHSVNDVSPPRRSLSRRRTSGVVQTDRPVGHIKAKSTTFSPVRDPVKSVRVWQKHQILTALEQVKETEKLLQEITAKTAKKQAIEEKMKEELKLWQDKKQTSTQKWAMKLQSHKKQESVKLAEVVKKADLSLLEYEARLRKLKEQKMMESKEKEDVNRSKRQVIRSFLEKQERITDLEVKDRMEKYQSRMDKSERSHNQLLKSRSQSAAKRRQKVDLCVSQLAKSTEESDISRLVDFLKKQLERESKLEQSREEQNKSLEVQKRRKEAKWLAVEKHKKEARSREESYMRRIEEKRATSQSVVESRHQSVMKETFYKQELQKEREDRNQHNLAKLKRIQSARQAQIFHKSAEDAKRVNQLKQSRKHTIEKYQEALHSSMMERDRTYELVEIISKSPNSKRLQKVIKDFSQVM